MRALFFKNISTDLLEFYIVTFNNFTLPFDTSKVNQINDELIFVLPFLYVLVFVVDSLISPAAFDEEKVSEFWTKSTTQIMSVISRGEGGRGEVFTAGRLICPRHAPNVVTRPRATGGKLIN